MTDPIDFPQSVPQSVEIVQGLEQWRRRQIAEPILVDLQYLAAVIEVGEHAVHGEFEVCIVAVSMTKP